MNLNVLRSFVAVVEHQSLSKAGNELHLTQPGVSKHIQWLENYYGVQLLHRMGRKTRLTEEGKLLYYYAKQILQLVDKAGQVMGELSSNVKGRLVIGASTIPGEYIMPYVIGAFKKEYPEVQVSVEIANTQEIVNRLVNEEINLGIVGAKLPAKKVQIRRLMEDEIVLIAPPDHLLAGQTGVRPQILYEQRLIWREHGSGTRTVVEEKLHEAGIDLERLPIVMELGSTEALITAVKAGLGLAFVSWWAARVEVERGKLALIRLDGISFERDLYLMYPQKKSRPKVVQMFLDFTEGRDIRDLIIS